MPSYWELKSQLDKLRPVRRVALDDRARIVAEQAKLAADLTAANNVLASKTEEAAAEVVTKVLGNEYLMNSKGY